MSDIITHAERDEYLALSCLSKTLERLAKTLMPFLSSKCFVLGNFFFIRSMFMLKWNRVFLFSNESGFFKKISQFWLQIQ